LYPLLLKSGLRIWIYSGDVDANVPITGTLEWIYMLQKRGLLKEKNSWRSWFIPGDMTGELQVGGMVWNLNRLTFVSIREAGFQ
jgi:serine carboxypeptidase-like clade 2